ncbi:hypothetical protein EJB05_30078 [Eragrostis curvula]|uniref:Uncharacterized protein n=1 Tax=Eragrostis curvula TaxID=38414 RepID=A0A5J9UWF9_9POAL|nr:hypothetical protein EJB05_30078 [Eragrostis curvula]
MSFVSLQPSPRLVSRRPPPSQHPPRRGRRPRLGRAVPCKQAGPELVPKLLLCSSLRSILEGSSETSPPAARNPSVPRFSCFQFR